MDIRQLRAGNLVTTNGKPSGTTKGNIYKILDTNSANRLDELGLVGGVTLQILDGEYQTTVGAWLDYLEPIKVTVDLLKSIGFTNYRDDLLLNTGKHEIYISKTWISGISYISIYDDIGNLVLMANLASSNFYLHILQNIILDITGTDLNVDNLISK